MQAASENIAEGQETPKRVVEDWMSSRGHRTNILGNWKHVGFGIARQNRPGLEPGTWRHYWCAKFAR